MRLIYTSRLITDTVLVDDSGHRLYATSTSTFGRQTEVMKSGHMWNSNLATLRFHRWRSDTITINGQKRTAKSYITKPSWWSRRRVFTSASGYTYEWVPKGNKWRLRLPDGREAGRSHSRSRGLLGKKHKPYPELINDPNILNDLDELVATFLASAVLGVAGEEEEEVVVVDVVRCNDSFTTISALDSRSALYPSPSDSVVLPVLNDFTSPCFTSFNLALTDSPHDEEIGMYSGIRENGKPFRRRHIG
ncbi:unnamed protein product [Peniophora sp. CBMAI 1063]|nr:unnamed protein product [Peniophora sp. CBMAI 1063]